MAGYVIAIVLLLLLVAAQAAYHFRDSIVTFWPVTRPAFERVCAVAGCAIRPAARRRDELSVDRMRPTCRPIRRTAAS